MRRPFPFLIASDGELPLKPKPEQEGPMASVGGMWEVFRTLELVQESWSCFM